MTIQETFWKCLRIGIHKFFNDSIIKIFLTKFACFENALAQDYYQN